jgi:hypothetical protein
MYYVVMCYVVICYVHGNWRIRRHTKKSWIKKGVEEGENYGIQEGRIRDRVRK